MSVASTRAAAAAQTIISRTGVRTHDIALILGSGWGEAADLIGREVASISSAEIPGFKPAAVAGHTSSVRSLETESGKRILVLGGRQHFYESRDAATVAHAVRTANAAGCRTLVLTNGCGSIDPSIAPGTPVLIGDHINFTGATPLTGATFVDMTAVYSPRLRAIAKSIDPALTEGVYMQFTGPQYETPAEVRMAGVLGATLVGMSTVLEAIAAREADMEVLGLSLVTNLAAGISGETLSHAEVLDAGRNAGPRISRLLADIVQAM